jgi:hypothetical protein
MKILSQHTTMWFVSVLIQNLSTKDPEYFYICRKLTVSAFRRYKGLGVCDSVFVIENAFGRKGRICVLPNFFMVIENVMHPPKYLDHKRSYVYSTLNERIN